MEIKYVVIDLSKFDGDKLSEMLEKAYKDGYQKGRECIGSINAPTIPYYGDYYTTTTSSSGMEIRGDSLNTTGTIVVNGNSISPIAAESAISSISNKVSD